MKIFVVLGADRVGKTTSIQNTVAFLKESGQTSRIWHFSEVKPWHHSPIDQFLEKFDELDCEALTDRPDYLFIDRFVSDTLFYEPERNRFARMSEHWADTVESRIWKYGCEVQYVVINRLWDSELINRHKRELLKTWEACCPPGESVSKYYLDLNLAVRKKEHVRYYSHTSRFLDSRDIRYVTLFDKSPDSSLNLLKDI